MQSHEFVPEDDAVRRMLMETRTIAVVGLSDNPSRPSNSVSAYLKQVGYRIIPVTPMHEHVWGIKSYPDLAAVNAAGHEVDLVDVFRRPETVMPVVRQAIEIGAKAIWFQEGVVNEEAARLAKEAGLFVVMDRCTFKEHARLVGG